jgi:hypothetical protein
MAMFPNFSEISLYTAEHYLPSRPYDQGVTLHWRIAGGGLSPFLKLYFEKGFNPPPAITRKRTYTYKDVDEEHDTSYDRSQTYFFFVYKRSFPPV